MNEETNQQSAPLANQHLANKIAGIVNDKGEIIANEEINSTVSEIESSELESDESEISTDCTVDTDAQSDETTKEDAQN